MKRQTYSPKLDAIRKAERIAFVISAFILAAMIALMVAVLQPPAHADSRGKFREIQRGRVVIFVPTPGGLPVPVVVHVP